MAIGEGGILSQVHLVNCAVCGKAVASDAKVCPHCGTSNFMPFPRNSCEGYSDAHFSNVSKKRLPDMSKKTVLVKFVPHGAAKGWHGTAHCFIDERTVGREEQLELEIGEHTAGINYTFDYLEDIKRGFYHPQSEKYFTIRSSTDTVIINYKPAFWVGWTYVISSINVN